MGSQPDGLPGKVCIVSETSKGPGSALSGIERRHVVPRPTAAVPWWFCHVGWNPNGGLRAVRLVHDGCHGRCRDRSSALDRTAPRPSGGTAEPDRSRFLPGGSAWCARTRSAIQASLATLITASMKNVASTAALSPLRSVKIRSASPLKSAGSGWSIPSTRAVVSAAASSSARVLFATTPVCSSAAASLNESAA